ncbi:MAG: Nucleotidyltransferase [Candidatus Roizmanbacteria bacterium GW2011_GWA2_37_7]|uniref:Nucleotidyltransferase n=1 Tax=Candidatus Roizmanbacteria bacterium GW2011_GWA2_37_7 TaxID=1618481 RepID=A0A0G0K7D4_9BACT|nr:MAG: Nucleotidyltransferase [Candidatus Roizmanbacteria bacterium GW2011_GWA2_37_7]
MNKSVGMTLRRFSKVAKKEISADAKCFVFGSYAKGVEKKWSDIDVAVIVSKIKDVLEGEKKLRLYALDIDERINPFIFTLEDMNENSPLVWEVKKYGKEIG